MTYIILDQRLHHTDSLSQSMMLIYQTVFNIQGKISGPWNIGHNDLQIFLGLLQVILAHNPKVWYICLQDIRQNHWTMKYRSQWPRFILRSNNGLYWLIIPNHQIVFKIYGKITEPWNIGHSDLNLFWGQTSGHTLTHNPKVWSPYIKQSSRYKAKSLDHGR